MVVGVGAGIDLHGDFVADLMKNLSHEDGKMKGICILNAFHMENTGEFVERDDMSALFSCPLKLLDSQQPLSNLKGSKSFSKRF